MSALDEMMKKAFEKDPDLEKKLETVNKVSYEFKPSAVRSEMALNATMKCRGKEGYSSKDITDNFKDKGKKKKTRRKPISNLFIENPREDHYICKIDMPMLGEIIVAHDGEHFYQETVLKQEEFILSDGEKRIEKIMGIVPIAKDNYEMVKTYFKDIKDNYLALKDTNVEIINGNNFESMISNHAKNKKFLARLSIEEDGEKTAYFLNKNGDFCTINRKRVKSKLLRKLVHNLKQIIINKVASGSYEHSDEENNIKCNLDLYNKNNIEKIYKKYSI